MEAEEVVEQEQEQEEEDFRLSISRNRLSISRCCEEETMRRCVAPARKEEDLLSLTKDLEEKEEEDGCHLDEEEEEDLFTRLSISRCHLEEDRREGVLVKTRSRSLKSRLAVLALTPSSISFLVL